VVGGAVDALVGGTVGGVDVDVEVPGTVEELVPDAVVVVVVDGGVALLLLPQPARATAIIPAPNTPERKGV
jgi:hypothetical protein